jgi:hypothetical protein
MVDRQMIRAKANHFVAHLKIRRLYCLFKKSHTLSYTIGLDDVTSEMRLIVVQ